MSDAILYILILGGVAAMVAWKARRDVRRSRNERCAAAMLTAPETLTEEELATRRLIGNEAYDRMVERVDNVVERHGSDRCLNVKLTDGPDSRRGWKQLHSILPGDPLFLQAAEVGGIRLIEVYSGGFRIGSVAGESAADMLRILDCENITGAYVSEQNSYGDCNTADMRVILFYRPLAFSVPSSAVTSSLRNGCRVSIPESGREFTVCQN